MSSRLIHKLRVEIPLFYSIVVEGGVCVCGEKGCVWVVQDKWQNNTLRMDLLSTGQKQLMAAMCKLHLIIFTTHLQEKKQLILQSEINQICHNLVFSSNSV